MARLTRCDRSHASRATTISTRSSALEAASFTNPWTRDMLARELRHADVARSSCCGCRTRPVAAFCACWLVVDELHINTLAVDAADAPAGARRRRCCDYVLADAARRGRAPRDARSAPSNVAALRLYERLGFVVDGRAAELLHAAGRGRADPVARTICRELGRRCASLKVGGSCGTVRMNARTREEPLPRRRKCRQTSKS